MAARRRHWGWGSEDDELAGDELRAAAAGVREHLGFPPAEVEAAVPLAAVDLPPSRLPAPPAEVGEALGDVHARARCALGSSYVDVVAGFRGAFAHPPDIVLRPGDERELEAALAWCAEVDAAAIPYGGGTSVVGGVEPRVPGRFAGAVTLLLDRLAGVREVDAVSGAARVGAGTLGPALEAALAEDGLTARFFPQSFELSTVGGWVATRAGGHFATGPTHVDDLVESIRAVTPTGVWASRRLPGSGAGPSPDRLLLGSEGTLGVITEAWLRVQPRPRFRAGRSVRFASFAAGCNAVRALAQSGLRPANCRLVEAEEARVTMAGDGGAHLLVLAFESTDHDVEPALARGLELCREAGGVPDEPRAPGGAEAWRSAFLRAPYIRDVLVAGGVLSETFETAITWERLGALREAVTAAAQRALDDDRARVTCRLTHAYPDGAAPYFTVLAPARRGEEAGQWGAVKAAVSDALLDAGGTITHHHAVGRDHRPWYDRQRPDPFAAALRGAKAAVDPAGVLNPGVLVDHEGA